MTSVRWPGFQTHDLSKPPPSGEYKGIKTGEVTGWRAWQLKYGGRILASVTAPCRWDPGKTVTGDVDSWPGMVRGGVYAWDCLELAIAETIKMHRRWHLGPTGVAFVVGSVHLFGDVVTHVRGYRAEAARIAGFDYIQWVTANPDPAMRVVGSWLRWPRFIEGELVSVHTPVTQNIEYMVHETDSPRLAKLRDRFGV
jgi:hypothetical protein